MKKQEHRVKYKATILTNAKRNIEKLREECTNLTLKTIVKHIEMIQADTSI